MVQDRGHGGLWFIGFTGIEVPVSATLGGGFETDAWRIGQALAESGVVAPEAGVISALLAALRREGVSILAREPALEAPPASRRVWSFLHRPQIWASPHCAPGAEAGEVCDACGSREAAAIEEFIGVVARANDASRCEECGAWATRYHSGSARYACDSCGRGDGWVDDVHAPALRAARVP